MSDSNFAFLTVRTTSTRLPRKCFLQFGSHSVLEHVINRTIDSNLVPIVCTSDDKSDDEIERLTKDLKIEYFRGSLDNKLSRWYECARYFNVDMFHTIDVDDPFFDPIQVKESLDLLQNENLDVVFPTQMSSAGSASVGYSIRTDYLEKVIAAYRYIEKIEMVDALFNAYPATKGKILNTSVRDSALIRLTLDYEEDYFLLDFVRRILGANCTREMILKLFSENPNLYEINWFRNMDWSNKQQASRKDIRGRISN